MRWLIALVLFTQTASEFVSTDPRPAQWTVQARTRLRLHFAHDGVDVDWWSVHVNDTYYGHVGRDGLVEDGYVHFIFPYGLPAGFHRLRINACNDSGCESVVVTVRARDPKERPAPPQYPVVMEVVD